MILWKWSIIRTRTLEAIKAESASARMEAEESRRALIQEDKLRSLAYHSLSEANLYARYLQERLKQVDPLWFVGSIENNRRAKEARRNARINEDLP